MPKINLPQKISGFNIANNIATILAAGCGMATGAFSGLMLSVFEDASTSSSEFKTNAYMIGGGLIGGVMAGVSMRGLSFFAKKSYDVVSHKIEHKIEQKINTQARKLLKEAGIEIPEKKSTIFISKTDVVDANHNGDWEGISDKFKRGPGSSL
jgi:hypothetical protein